MTTHIHIYFILENNYLTGVRDDHKSHDEVAWCIDIFECTKMQNIPLFVTWTNMRTLINAWKSQLFYPLIIRNGKRYLVRGEEKEKKRTTENATTRTQHKREIRLATLPSKNLCCALVITVSVTVYPHFQSHNCRRCPHCGHCRRHCHLEVETKSPKPFRVRLLEYHWRLHTIRLIVCLIIKIAVNARDELLLSKKAASLHHSSQKDVAHHQSIVSWRFWK